MFPLLKLPCRINAIFPKPEISFFYDSFSVAESLISLDVHASSRGKHSNSGTFRSGRPHTRAIFLTPYDS